MPFTCLPRPAPALRSKARLAHLADASTGRADLDLRLLRHAAVQLRRVRPARAVHHHRAGRRGLRDAVGAARPASGPVRRGSAVPVDDADRDVAARAARFRGGVLVAVVVAVGSLALDQGPFWAGDLTSLSPVPPAEQRLDQSLRRDMRAPDAGYLVVIRRPDQEAALQAADDVAADANAAGRATGIAGFDTPTRYLPSLAAQRARQAALPDAGSAAGRSRRRARRIAVSARSVRAVRRRCCGSAQSARPVTAFRPRWHVIVAQARFACCSARTDGWVAMLSLRGVTAPAAIDEAIGAEPGACSSISRPNRIVCLRSICGRASASPAWARPRSALLLAVSLRSVTRLLMIMRTARRFGRRHTGDSASGRPCAVDLQPVRAAAGGRHRLELLPVLRPAARTIRRDAARTGVDAAGERMHRRRVRRAGAITDASAS